VLAADAEICDECGATSFEPLGQIGAALCAWAGTRPVVFRLPRDRAALIGRAAPGEPAPDIDLSRLPGSASVHRRHARIEPHGGAWRISQLGTNPLIIDGREHISVPNGGWADLNAGNSLQVGGIQLHLVVRDLVQRI
jgi:FHA domain